MYLLYYTIIKYNEIAYYILLYNSQIKSNSIGTSTTQLINELYYILSYSNYFTSTLTLLKNSNNEYLALKQHFTKYYRELSCQTKAICLLTMYDILYPSMIA